MRTHELSPLLESPGPFATVLTDVSHDSENAEQEHQLRVRSACEDLAEQGADPDVVETLRERLGEPVGRPAPVSRLLVANVDGIQYDEVAGMRVDRPVSTWGPLPDLSAWVEHRDSALTFVLAVVDHEGGDVALYDSDVPDPEEETTVGGESEHVHKVPVGGWSALRYQHVTENVWARNADAVVDEVTSLLRRGHRLVLLAGDPQSRGLVRARLEDTDAEVVELPTGTRSEDGGEEALQQAIRDALMHQVVSRRLALAHELQERLGRQYAVAIGVHDVANAFVRGQVDTLLLDPAAAAEVRLDVSEHPGLVLGPQQLPEPVRADQALVAAAVLTDAEVAVLRNGALGGSPVAALLRWHQDAVGEDAR